MRCIGDLKKLVVKHRPELAWRASQADTSHADAIATSQASFHGVDYNCGPPLQPLPLNSWHFLLFCAVAVRAMRGLSGGWTRAGRLARPELLLPLVFHLGLVSAGRAGGAAGLHLCGGGNQGPLGNQGARRGLDGGLVLLWLFLFLGKDPKLLRARSIRSTPIRSG